MLLRRDGFKVLKIPASEILRDIDAALRLIIETCCELGPLHHDAARRGPPPRSGEELL